MNMNDILNLFGVDFEKLSNKFNELQTILENKYNDIASKVKKYDIDTEEGYEAFIKEAAELRKDLSKEDNIFNKYMLNLLDKMVEYAMNKHNEDKKNKTNPVKEIVNTEVERVNKENHNKNKPCTCNKDFNNGPSVKPSSMLTYKQSRNIWKLVNKYMETMVEPYVSCDIDDETLDNMASGLYEFAAWILNEKED